MSSDLNKRLDTILQRQVENRSEIDTLAASVADLSAFVAEVQTKAVQRSAPARRSARDVTEQLGTLLRGFFAATKGGSLEAAYKDAGCDFAEVKASLNESTSTGGVYLIPTTLADSIYALDGVAGAYRQAGARIMQTDSGNINIPVRSADSTIAVVAEGANSTESTPTFSQTAVALEKYKAYCEASEEVIQDNAYGIGQYCADHLLSQIERKIDANAFTVVGTAVNVTYSGATPTTFDGLVKAYYKLPLAAQPTASWVMRPEAWAKILTLKNQIDITNNSAGNAALASYSIFDGKPTPTLLGRPVWFCDQLTGTGDSSSVYIGSFDRGCVLAEHAAGTVILIDPYSASVAGKVRIFAQKRAKAAVPLPTALAQILTYPHLT